MDLRPDPRPEHRSEHRSEHRPGRWSGRPAPGTPPDVWVLTADPELAERLERLCDAAGVRFRSLPGPAGLPRDRGPGLVLLGADAVSRAGTGPPPSGADAGTDGGTDGRADGRADGDAAALLRNGSGPVVLVTLQLDGEPVPAQVWRLALDVGADQVATLPEAEPWLVDRLLGLRSGPEPAPVLAVLGGRGGAGASVLAVALALAAAAAGHRPALVDADPLGVGLDLVLGAERLPGLRWGDLTRARGRLDGQAVLHGLPAVDGIGVLSWGAGPAAEVGAATAAAVLDGLSRNASVVVLDLPRAPSDASRALLARSDLGLLVVPADVGSAAAAARLCAAVGPVLPDLRLVVRGPAPTGLPAEAVAEALDLPLVGRLRPEPGLAAALDRGEPPALRPRGPLAVLCRRLVGELLPVR